MLAAFGRHLGEVEGREQAVQRQVVLLLDARSYGVQAGHVEHHGELTAAVGTDEDRAVVAAGRVPEPPEGLRR